MKREKAQKPADGGLKEKNDRTRAENSPKRKADGVKAEEKKMVLVGKKAVWKPGTMVYPLPAVMVSCADRAGNTNILTIAWTGTVCSDPAMAYISVRPERFSHHMIEETGEFVINLTTEALCAATDFCGVKSGAKLDKWEACGLTRQKASAVGAPLIAESPVNIECRVTQTLRLGSHDMFLAKVEAVDVDERYLDEKGRFAMEDCGLIAYSHGAYHSLGKLLGTFGYTVKKK